MKSTLITFFAGIFLTVAGSSAFGSMVSSQLDFPTSESPAISTPNPTSRTLVNFNTNLGSFQAILYNDLAPVSVTNFLRYVDSQIYNQSIIHRSIPGFVIQGGGYYDLTNTTESSVPSFNPIPLENPFGNRRGTLGMARTQDPNSATSQWFINLADNSFLDQSGSNQPGYGVFGEIIGDGMSVVDAIANLPINPAISVSPVPLLNGGSVSLSISSVPEPTTLNYLLLGGLITCFIAKTKNHEKPHSNTTLA